MNIRCYQTAATLRAQHLSRDSFFVVALTAACFAGVASFAAPITLRFNTAVANTFGLPLGPVETSDPLPFPVAPGDPLTVTFTYEPWTGTGTFAQSGLLQATMGAQTLVAPFQVVVKDDVFALIDTPGRIVGTAPNVDIVAFYVDQTTLTCPGGVGTYCGTVSGHDELKFTSQLVFEDRDLQTLTLNDSSNGAGFWNAFDMREMRIGFNNGAFVGAYIPLAREVPESVGMLGAVLGILFMLKHISYWR